MDTTSKIMGTYVRILPLLCSSLLYFAFNIADIIWPHFIGLSQEAEKEQWGQNRKKSFLNYRISLNIVRGY